LEIVLKFAFYDKEETMCLVTLFSALISRIAILVWWLASPQSHNLPFKDWIIPGGYILPAWIWVLLGAIFLPVTTLAYLFLFPGGITGNEWIILGAALLIDLLVHGGSYRNRRRLSLHRD
jgi:hypothetical protein